MSPIIAQDLPRFGPRAAAAELPCFGEALAYVRHLTRSRRENFHVLSSLLPPRLRDDFAAVYAYCRWADDLGDETGDPSRGNDLLGWWESELRDCFDGRARHPVFIVLRQTVVRHDLPLAPFLDLLTAFRQDQRVARSDTWDDLLEYCRRSANPVGRIVLHLFDDRDPAHAQLSDRTCTALQLVNFWQDVRPDWLERRRVYLPRDLARRHGVDVEDLPGNDLTRYRALVRDLCTRTESLFCAGHALVHAVPADARPVIALFGWGGESLLREITRRDFDTWTTRPRVGALRRAGLLARAWAMKVARRQA